MTALDVQRPSRLARRALVALAAGAAALVGFLAAAFAGANDLQAAAAGVFGAAAATALGLWLNDRSDTALEGGRAAQGLPEPPYALALEGLPDPVMLVAGG